MPEMESIERVIRATAEEFGECPGWTKLLADAVKELDAARAPHDEKLSQVYVYRWNRMNRRGHRCIVLCRGSMNSCIVRFDDGHVAVTSRNALAKVKGESVNAV